MYTRIALLMTLFTCAQSTALAEVAAAPPRPADPAPPPARPFAIELTTLRLLRDKGVISQADYDSAMVDLGNSVGSRGGDAPTLVLGRWSTTLYGFVEADSIFDTTQSFNDAAGNAQVARSGTYAGQNGRLTFGVRDSRIGLQLRAPTFHGVRASANLEMDFLGNQPTTVSEAQFFINPAFRVRHMNLRIETPIVDILIGQYWDLFGWQPNYQPNAVAIPGVPGSIFGRTPQIRLSKTIKLAPMTIELAAAIMRPPQRDSEYPEGQAGLRVAFDKWTGYYTTYATGSKIQPLSLAVTADVRRFKLPEFAAMPTRSVDSDVGYGIAVDALLPVLSASDHHKSNALTINGEFAYSYGAADLYSGLSSGVAFPALPNPDNLNPAPTYTPDVDPGLVVYGGDGHLHLVHWQSYLVGVQYYFPGLDGRGWISGNYSHTGSSNSKMYGTASKIREAEDWFDVNLFGDVLPSVRLGLEYSYFRDRYVDGDTPVNHRVQLSAFYLF